MPPTPVPVVSRFFPAEDGIRDKLGLEFRRVLFRSIARAPTRDFDFCAARVAARAAIDARSEERRVGKEWGGRQTRDRREINRERPVHDAADAGPGRVPADDRRERAEIISAYRLIGH